MPSGRSFLSVGSWMRRAIASRYGSASPASCVNIQRTASFTARSARIVHFGYDVLRHCSASIAVFVIAL